MERYKVRRAAVIGARTMGARIAAHLANAGVPTLLFDVVPSQLTPAETARGLSLESPQVRNRVVQAGWKGARDGRPDPLFSPELALLVTPLNLEDDLARLAEADWIVEAVTERAEVKRSVFRRIEHYRRPGTVVSTNTSGLSIRDLCEGFSPDFRSRFLGTHFFNPPRQTRLLEVVPGPDTDPALVEFMRTFGEQRLGKGVIVCRDTPSFIANRIGCYALGDLLRRQAGSGFTVEEVDALTGPLIGRPSSATFRTIDVIGLDTLLDVFHNLHAAVTDDPERDTFLPPPAVETVAGRGWLGEKAGQGFYRRVRDERGESRIQQLDLETFEYRPLARPQFPALRRVSAAGSPRARLRALFAAAGREAELVRENLAATLCYAASTMPAIADEILDVDRAMRWGYMWQLGPFETWDALGVRVLAERLAKGGREVPAAVESLLSAGHNSFYRRRAGRSFQFSPGSAGFVRAAEPPGRIALAPSRRRSSTVLGNDDASLVDIGDGVACLRFHTKMNTLNRGVLDVLNSAVAEVERNLTGLVIANEGDVFSAGADIRALLGPARDGRWDELDAAVRAFQDAHLRIRYSACPVVIAPHNLSLGGACEMTLHCDQVHASAELYTGFVETAIGVIPAAGGCKEMLARIGDGAVSESELYHRLCRLFEMIAKGKVSGSALEAQHMGLLRSCDRYCMNPAHRISLAKSDVLALARQGYRTPVAPAGIPVLGEPAFASLRMGLHQMRSGGYISEFDEVVATRLARVLTGGSMPGMRRVSERYLLDLERETFLSLCGETRTHWRMEHMLKTGKALRN